MKHGTEGLAGATATTSGQRSEPSRRMLMGGVFAGGLAAWDAAHAGPPSPSVQSPSNDEVGTVWWVELVTNDETKAADFYEAAIGWKTRAADAGYTLFIANGKALFALAVEGHATAAVR